MGVDSYGCQSYANVSIIVRPSFTLTNSSPNSPSAADDATNVWIFQRVKLAPLSGMNSPYLGTEPRNNFPDA